MIKRLVSVSDGRSTSLWFDNLHPICLLTKCFREMIIINYGLGRDARVSCIDNQK